MTRAIKQPDQELAFTYDFSAELGAATIASVTMVSNTARGASAILSESSRATFGTSVVVNWAGGTSGDSYLTRVEVLDNAGRSHVIEGEIQVQDFTFVVPLGVTSTYLTGEEYVAEFGREETVRITDESRSGTIDAGKLARALNNATAFVDGYIATRYTVPLASVPAAIKGIVAALAREELHKTRPTLAVTEAADRARSQLKDYSAGRAVLLLPTAVEPESTVTRGLAVWGSSDAVVFNAEKLSGYGYGI